MNNMYEDVDAVCAALAPQRSREVIELVLKTFIPLYEHLNSDYASPQDDPNRPFASEDDMIDYFVRRGNIDQVFFWNQYKENSDRIMVGAFFTDDNKLIMSLTVTADGKLETIYLDRLKTLLDSDIGVISYTGPPLFDDGADFIKRYST